MQKADLLIKLLISFQDSSERLRPLQAKIDRLREEKDEVIRKKDDKIEAAKAEVLIYKQFLTFSHVNEMCMKL